MHQSVRHGTLLAGVEVISIVSDRSFPRHTHDEFGLGYLVDGAQKSWSGRGLVESEAGDIITVNPGEVHDGIARKNCPRHWCMLFITPAALSLITGQVAETIELHQPVLRDKARLSLLARAIGALISAEPDSDLVEEQLLLALHGMMSPVAMEEPSKAYSHEVTRVMERIEAESASPLKLEDFAGTAQMSRYKILRQFAIEVGITPHAYLLQHRVKMARRYLQAGMTLADVAAASGFADQSHMTRSFARQFGMTPGRYKRAQST